MSAPARQRTTAGTNQIKHEDNSAWHDKARNTNETFSARKKSQHSAVESRFAWPKTADDVTATGQTPSYLRRASSESQIAASRLSKTSGSWLSRNSRCSDYSQISSFVGSTQSQVYPWEVAGMYTHKIDHLEVLFKPPGVKREIASTSHAVHRHNPEFLRESRNASSTGFSHKWDQFTDYHEERIAKGGIMRQ